MTLLQMTPKTLTPNCKPWLSKFSSVFFGGIECRLAKQCRPVPISKRNTDQNDRAGLSCFVKLCIVIIDDETDVQFLAFLHNMSIISSLSQYLTTIFQITLESSLDRSH